jgi:hypothetical protein
MSRRGQARDTRVILPRDRRRRRRRVADRPGVRSESNGSRARALALAPAPAEAHPFTGRNSDGGGAGGQSRNPVLPVPRRGLLFCWLPPFRRQQSEQSIRKRPRRRRRERDAGGVRRRVDRASTGRMRRHRARALFCSSLAERPDRPLACGSKQYTVLRHGLTAHLSVLLI